MPDSDGKYLSPKDAETHIREKHVQMIKDAQKNGREIKAIPVSQEQVGTDLARTAVEASQRSMKLAARKVFSMPQLPWKL